MLKFFKSTIKFRYYFLVPFFFLALTVSLNYKMFLNDYVPLPLNLLDSFLDKPYEKEDTEVFNNLVGDSIYQIFPWKKLAAEQLKQGNLPILNPYVFAGNFLLANGQSGVFYIGNIFLLLFGVIKGWNVLFFMQFFIASIFTYIYLRNLRISINGSLIGGTVFGFSGFMLAWSSWTTIGHTILWWPLVLYAIDRWLLSEKIRWIVVGSMAIMFMVFAGHPQFSFYGLLLIASYILFRSFTYLKKIKSRSNIFLGLFCILFIGLGLSSIQLIPTISAVGVSMRFVGLKPEAANTMLPSENLLTFLVPSFFGWPNNPHYFGVGNFNETTFYFGLTALFLVVYSILKFKNSHIEIFFILLFFSLLLLAFDNPISRILSPLHIKIFARGISGRVLSILPFTAAVLAAFGFDSLLNDLKRKCFTKSILISVVFLLIVVEIVVLTGLRYVLYPYSKDIFQLGFIFEETKLPLLILCSILGSLIITYISRQAFRLIPAVILLLLVIELLRVGYVIIPWSNPTRMISLQEQYFYLTNLNPFERVVGQLNEGIAVIYNMPIFSGYDSIFSKNYYDLIDKKCKSLSDGSTNWITIFPEDCPDFLKNTGLKYIIDKDDKYVRKDASSKLISNLEVVRKINKITIYKSNNYTVPIFLEKEKIIIGDNIKNISFVNNQITLVSHVKNNQDMTLAINFLDGWDGYIDSRKVDVRKSEEGFIKIFIPNGEHEVKLLYFPAALRVGLNVFIASVGLLVLFTFVGLKQKRL